MPVCTDHNSGCNCGLVNIPIPAEPGTNTEETEEEPLTCDVCSEPEGDCECYTCEGCERRFETVCNRCECCERCCSDNGECFYCEGCERTRYSGDRCSNCDECDRCCTCCTCQRCGEISDSSDFCGECDRCLNCCRCSDEENCHCELLEGSDEFHTAKRSEHKQNPSKRYIAAEIEVASLDSPTKSERIRSACSEWGAAIVSDGSLPDTGFEINTAPASGDLYVSQVGKICTALKVCGAKVNTDCGLHVHIDARDYSYYELRRLIRLYAIVEDALFGLVSNSRQNNHFCSRCGAEYLAAVESGDVRKMKDTIAKAVYKDSKDLRFKRTNKYEPARYRALNLHSWFYRGTIECRLFNGSTDAEKIVNWGMLWAGLLDWVYSHRDKDVEALKGKPSLDVLLSVCPTETVRQWVEDRSRKFSEE